MAKGRTAPTAMDSLKRNYREAKNRGDREEEARWANQIGHACKDRGEYVEALKWFKLDYDISARRKGSSDVSLAQMMPTCQCLGEIYLRLQNYKMALEYQRQHYDLAIEAADLVEQQRAVTQLGRTYLEMYENHDALQKTRHHENDQSIDVLEKARQFLKISFDLTRSLKQNPPNRDCSSFVKELVDAYNNMGLLKMATDDYHQAKKYFLQGLKICDEEELSQNDDARSRLHHNLGRVYCEQRDWEDAKEHTSYDISICQRIGHKQGEAKGYINLGEMYFKQQKYEEAIQCYRRALKITQTLEDEDALLRTCKENIQVVQQAQTQMEEFRAGEQRLKKLQRVSFNRSRSNTKEEYKTLADLVTQAEDLQLWEKYLELGKRMLEVATELVDCEKKGDAYDIMGRACYHLRRFEESKQWHNKSWEFCRDANLVEGAIVAKQNYGNALDANGECQSALKAYEEAYKIASSKGKDYMLKQQINALENIQYAYSVRLGEVEKAREVQRKLGKLKSLWKAKNDQPEFERHSESDGCEDGNLEPEDGNSPTPGGSEVEEIQDRNRKNVLELNCDRSRIQVEEVQNGRRESSKKKIRKRQCIVLSDGESDDSLENLYGLSQQARVDLDDAPSTRSKSRKGIYQEGSRVSTPMVQGSKFEGSLRREVSESRKYVSLEDNDVPQLKNHSLVERYKLQCQHCHTTPSLKLIEKLNISQDSAGELDASECSLDDVSVLPLIQAIQDSEALSVLNLAHNDLGNATMDRIQLLISSMNNKELGLKLDVHDNKLSAGALAKVSQCNIMMSRLEVLNLSANRLTDRSARHLATIVKHCDALLTLELEDCGIESGAILKLANALPSRSSLGRLSIGRNSPISDVAMKTLVNKLSSLDSFTDLDLTSVELSEVGLRSIINLVQQSSSLSGLSIRRNNLAKKDNGVILLAKSLEGSDLMKLDMSECHVSSIAATELCHRLMSCVSLRSLNLSGNQLGQQAINVLALELGKPECDLRILNLSNCGIGEQGIVSLIKSLQASSALEELHLAANSLANHKNSFNSTMEVLEVDGSSTMSDNSHCNKDKEMAAVPLATDTEWAGASDHVPIEDVADSEDTDSQKQPLSKKSKQKIFIERLACAIEEARGLQILDLSSNGIALSYVAELCDAWTSCRAPLPQCHVDGGLLHFFLKDKRCCAGRPCCFH